jgi:hypothetical protein
MALGSQRQHFVRRVCSLKEFHVPYARARLALAFTIGLMSLVMLASCRSPNRRGQAVQRPETFVEVENRSMLDMTIYVMRSGERRRLGLVNALSTQILSIPPVLVEGLGVLRFVADPIGASRTPVSEEIAVRHGDTVRLIIPPQ